MVLRWARSPVLLLAVLVYFISTFTNAHTIEVAASQKECFFEDLHVHDTMTVTYQVGGGGHMDIDFWLSDPAGMALNKQYKQSTGSTTITAKKDGRYEYCFSNVMSTIADKVVSFNVHGVMYVSDDEHMAPIEKEIRRLAQGLQAVKDEQEYIVVRERVHRNTAESTNERVMWWSIFQSILLFVVCAWQVYYLKSFFEVKRVI